MDDNECLCCVTKYSLRRKKVQCLKCKFCICNTCFERYTLDNIALDYMGTMCMNCKEPLSFDFIVENTTKTFLNKKWKDRRKDLLIDIEMSKMPNTQLSASTYREYKNSIDNLHKIINESRVKICAIMEIDDNQPVSISDMMCTLRSSCDFAIECMTDTDIDDNLYRQYTDQYKKQDKQLADVQDYYETYMTSTRQLEKLIRQYNAFINSMLVTDDDVVNNETRQTERRVFIMPCPINECKGFMSSQYKCGLCNGKICSKCHIQLNDKDEEHVCNKDLVESVKAINSETKPCPKCGARIYKTEGCDQMYCIGCHTAFSWETGKIAIGERIHNPEYFRWMREHNQEIPRVENQFLCEEGLPNYYDIVDLQWQLNYNMNLVYNVTELLCVATHIREVEIPKRKLKLNRDIRVKYLCNEITRENMMITLMKRERLNMKQTFIIGMLRLIVDVISDKIRLISREPSEILVESVMDEMLVLCKYVNEQMENFTKVHGLLTPKYNEDKNRLFEEIKNKKVRKRYGKKQEDNDE